MRKVLVAVAVAGLLLAACAEDQPALSTGATGATGTSGPVPSQPMAGPADCAAGQEIPYVNPGMLTIGTDNPAFEPWFAGGVPDKDSVWKFNDPSTGKGYESATAYAIADQLGFTTDQVMWVVVPWNESFKPGDKSFDLDLNETEYTPDRAQVVDFSDGYYDVQQALVAKKGTPITEVTTFDELKPYKLGVQIGTTSYSYVIDNIDPDQDPNVYDRSVDVIAALNAGQIDGYVTDAPTAYVNVLISQVKDGEVVGRFPTIGEQGYYGAVFQKGNPLVACVNYAIGNLQADGTLAAFETQWLGDVTFPEITP
jgi:polar amino acid transport system substrate-binding protein